MRKQANEPFKPTEFKGTRQQRRARARQMNKAYRATMYEVELFDGDCYYVIALNSDHVKEMLEAHEDKVTDERIYWIKPLNPEQMKLVTVDADTTLYDTYLNYTGTGAIIASTLW
jgi:hypothetical protein